jgi:hypothetical protein
MAELDYAFVADYATVTGGKLTAVGASYTYVLAASLPGMHQLAIAGRVRATLDEKVHLAVRIKAPNDAYEIRVEGELQRDDSARPYGGDKVGLLWSANVPISLPTEGLYEVFIDLDGKQVRRLAFDVAVASDSDT